MSYSYRKRKKVIKVFRKHFGDDWRNFYNDFINTEPLGYANLPIDLGAKP